MNKRKLRFYLVDDSIEFMEAMTLYLQNELDAEICGFANDGSEAIEDEDISQADVVLMDIMMKRMNGLDATRILATRDSDIRVLAVTNSREFITKKNLLLNGFSGCVNKNSVFKEMTQALTSVISGGYYFSEGILVE